MENSVALRFASATLVCVLSLFAPRLASIAMAHAGETITIQADSNLGTPRRFTGFLHGITYDRAVDYTTTIGLLSALQPSLWRLSNQNNNVYGFVVTKAQFPRTHGTLITAIIQDAFNKQYGDPIVVGGCDTTLPNCFATFGALKSAWISFVDAFMQASIAANLTIHYYDIYAEPERGWVGVDLPQMLELLRDAHDAVRRHRPEAKIVAPSIGVYNRALLREVLTYAANNNLRLDALSWHDFGPPEFLPARVGEVRQYLSANPSLCNPTCPEVHINEYAGIVNHLVPGWAVGWLHYLEKAGVDQSHRACWVVSGGWSTCWAGFNGLLLQDNLSTQHIYWVYKWHADTLGSTRLDLASSSAKVVALARRDDGTDDISVLAGRYDGGTGSLALEVANYRYGSAQVTVERIPNNSNVPSALIAPTPVSSSEIPAVNGSVRVTLGDFQDGEAYLITLRPGAR